MAQALKARDEAVVPPQNLNAQGAAIRIQVIEGYVDKVVWPEKLARYRNFFAAYEAKIVADRPANIRTLERYLLLLGDLPGFKVSTKLEASKTQLAERMADLILDDLRKRHAEVVSADRRIVEMLVSIFRVT